MATQTTIFTDATVDGAKRTHLNKEYFDTNLLRMAQTKFVHAEYGQKTSIPKNKGKTVEFRRFIPPDPNTAMVGLTEGVTPDAQNIKQTRVTATCKQYGVWTEVSDLLKDTAIDDVMRATSDMQGVQIGTVLEWVARDAMNAGTNVQYAGGKTSRLVLTSSDKLTVTEVRKAVRTLKKRKAPMFSKKGKRPHYICICSPEATYDLQSDTLWQDVSKYSAAEQIYDGELGRMFGVVFVESTEAKVFKQSVCNKVNAAVTSGSSFVLKSDPTEEEIAYLSNGGNKIKIGSTEYTLASSGSYVSATKTVTVTATFTAQAGLSADDIVYSEDGGAPDATTKEAPDIHATLVFGSDAYGVVDIDGGGNVETILKPLGHGDDPLNQRATVGAKVNSFAALILNNDWLVRIEHGVSA